MYKRGFITLITLCVILAMGLPVSYYIGYKDGRHAMYDEVISAAGGVKGAQIAVYVPTTKEAIYHPMGICATCHKEARWGI